VDATLSAIVGELMSYSQLLTAQQGEIQRLRLEADGREREVERLGDLVALLTAQQGEIERLREEADSREREVERLGDLVAQFEKKHRELVGAIDRSASALDAASEKLAAHA
jgi:chromosome segregation ATPase